MKKITYQFFTFIMVTFLATGVYGQFDDLYYGSSESLVTPDNDIVYNDDNYDSKFYGEEEDFTYDDELDEYVDYYTNDYEVDGYQYTNRLQRYRLAVFASNYYGVPYWGTGAGFDGYFLSNYANDPFFASYVRNQLIFGPSYTRLRSVYGYGPYADPFSPFYNPYRTSGLYAGVGVGFGRGFGYNPYNVGYGGFGRGGGFGGGYYCPPYGGVVATNRLNRFNNGSVATRNITNTVRRTGTRTTSTRPVRTTANSYGDAASIRTNSATSTRRSVRNSANTRDRNTSVRKSVADRSQIGSSTSRRTSTRSGSRSISPRSSSRTSSRIGSSSRSTNRSYVPSSNRTSTRSAGATRSSTRSTSTRSSTRSSSTRSSSPRSSTRKTSPR